jgi:hypothetical protein
VVVEYEKRDRYEQNLGKVLLGREDMNLEQVRTGLAWHYKKYQGEQSVSDRVKYSVPRWTPDGMSEGCGLTLCRCRRGTIARKKESRRRQWRLSQ